MDRVFHDAFDFAGSPFRETRVFPSVNVWEDGQSLYAEAEVPGMTMENIEVFAQGDEFTIKGQRAPESVEPSAFHRRERGSGAFSRLVRLPVPIDADKVTASLRDGVLLITLPKAEQARTRKVEVRCV
jgi:HSP20 family protein